MRGIILRVIVASTHEQEKYITELVDEFYTSILPIYFSDDQIAEFEKMNILKPNVEDQIYNETLKDAFKIISSLQVLNTVLKNITNHNEIKYKDMFNKTSKTLNEYGYFFPLSLEQFLKAEKCDHYLSQYVKSTNDWMI